jgi:Fe-S cluster assembly protein SufD
VDEDQKYYLETRGISPADAEKMIVQGFLEPVIAEVPSESVQDQLRTLIEEKVS